MFSISDMPSKKIESSYYIGRSNLSPSKNLTIEINRNREFETMKENLKLLYEKFPDKKNNDEIEWQDLLKFLIFYVIVKSIIIVNSMIQLYMNCLKIGIWMVMIKLL